MTDATSRRPARSGVRVFTAGLVGLMLLSAVSLGVLALRSYHEKDAYLAKVEREMRAAGRDTTAEGCLDRVLAWRPTCLASRMLCDEFTPRAMRACLQGRSRRGYCASLPARRGGARFGYQDCQRRGVTRLTRRACGAAFRMLDLYCLEQSGARNLGDRDEPGRKPKELP